jgi:SAM-dependent methyltransferase
LRDGAMSDQTIRFEDGEAYERGMAVYSRLTGTVFLDWLSAAAGLRWVDVGCGNGAFTELLMQRTAPAEVQAVDPSEGQLAFARGRAGAIGAIFHQGDAMALPFEASRFDAAVMALVLFFVPRPERGIAEMMRVVRPGGLVSAYVWDVPGGGIPTEPIREALRQVGIEPASPPSAAVSSMPALRAAFTDAGLVQVETRTIVAERHFPNFEAYWTTSMSISGLGDRMAMLPVGTVDDVRARTRAILRVDQAGAVLSRGTANAIKGLVPPAT